MREAVEMIVKALVDEVDAVDVREVDRREQRSSKCASPRRHGKDNWQAGPNDTRFAFAGSRREPEEESIASFSKLWNERAEMKRAEPTSDYRGSRVRTRGA